MTPVPGSEPAGGAGGVIGTEEAFASCEAITRSQAKNFAYGIRLLRPPERRALSAVYAMARRIDDIGEGDEPAPVRLAGLGEVRAQLDRLAASCRGPAAPIDPEDRSDPVVVALTAVARERPLPVSAFVELVDGCEMDVTGTTYATFDDLVVYCRRVAGTIGRLSLGVFGSSDPDRAAVLADDLGVALQLTNILRDVVEDRAMGRVYLPARDAVVCGVGEDLSGPPEALAALVGSIGGRAVSWYERGLGLLPLLDRRSRACVSAMAGIYRHLLDRILADPLAVTRGRLSLPAKEKAWVAARSLVGVTP